MIKLFLIIFSLSNYAFAKNTCTEDINKKKISILVATGPGGGYDLFARALAEPLENMTKSKVVVQNNTSLSGFGAIRALNGRANNEIRILVLSARKMIETSESYKYDWKQSILPIATYSTDREVWLGRAGAEKQLRDKDTLVFGTSTSGDLTIRAVSKFINKSPKLVTRYTGSTDMSIAVLRGEIDLTSLSVTAAVRLLSSGSYSPWLVLSDVQEPKLRSVQHLFGRGGYLEEIYEKSSDHLKIANNLAPHLMNIADNYRMIFISSSNERYIECMEKNIRFAIESDLFKRKASKIGLQYGNLGSKESLKKINEVDLGLKRIKDFLKNDF